MMARKLCRIGYSDVFWDGKEITFVAGLTVDADGSPRAYHPDPTKGLDYIANAGRPGRWWGIATENGQPNGKPFVQRPDQPAPGFYVSTTSYQFPGFARWDTQRYVDSERIPFIVLPPRILKAVPGIVLGCHCVVDFKGRKSCAMVADVGPNNHIGEGSIALAKKLGIPSNPKTGGVGWGVFYTVWPGKPAMVDGKTMGLQKFCG